MRTGETAANDLIAEFDSLPLEEYIEHLADAIITLEAAHNAAEDDLEREET